MSTAARWRRLSRGCARTGESDVDDLISRVGNVIVSSVEKVGRTGRLARPMSQRRAKRLNFVRSAPASRRADGNAEQPPVGGDCFGGRFSRGLVLLQEARNKTQASDRVRV